MTKDEALKMAIKELKKLADDLDRKLWEKINKFEEALEQPAQEPVTWIRLWVDGDFEVVPNTLQGAFPVYTHPAPSWKELSHDEIGNCFDEVMIVDEISSEFTPINFARAIEQALKEKNHG